MMGINSEADICYGLACLKANPRVRISEDSAKVKEAYRQRCGLGGIEGPHLN